jgi:kynurenine formamidase
LYRITDLSHKIDDDTPVYPGDPTVSLTPAATLARNGFNLLHVRMGSQTATHVDAPYHFFDNGARLDELPLKLFLGTGVIVDVRNRKPRSRIEWADLSSAAERLAPGRILVLHTGWDQHWGSDAYFDHPFLTGQAAERVVASGVRTVAIDAPSVDETVPHGTPPDGVAAHNVLLGAGGAIVENLTNLDAVRDPEPVLSLLPLHLARADGGPVRAVALELHHDGA